MFKDLHFQLLQLLIVIMNLLDGLGLNHLKIRYLFLLILMSLLQANFKKKTYPLTVNISGNGSVKEEIVSTSKSTDYEVGTTIRLTPIPIADETIFLKWAGDLTGDDSPVEITVDQPKTVTATFEFAVYNGVVGMEGKKEKAGTSKNFEIDYIILILILHMR